MESLSTSQNAILTQMTEMFAKLNTRIDQMASQAPNEAVEHSCAPTRAQAGRAGSSNSSHHISSTHPYVPKTIKMDFPHFMVELIQPAGYVEKNHSSKFMRHLWNSSKGFTLGTTIRTDVQANRPIDLTSAIGLARLYEARDNSHRRVNVPISKVGIQSQKTTTPTSPMLLFKKMTPEELNERKRKGLCFRCNEKFGLGHQCKKLFLIQASFNDSDEDEDMGIEGDSEIGLQPTTSDRFMVMVASGEKLSSLDKVVTLHDLSTPKNKIVGSPQWKRAAKKGREGILLQLYAVKASPEHLVHSNMPTQVQQILHKYKMYFLCLKDSLQLVIMTIKFLCSLIKGQC
ncbi:hypothetical protein JRO89_XS09G0135600 [Xanthoceras sorbifolium]|uniref:Uncharacterized protein n=1 Tax=Xanthoceras sorbifolium TaxID=99658 RepID=A0ABQ8HL84_9ROSI|nr:hypothetical protein JRO89_XS09G0135600 [Xanthoceras sorbifolium]